jgi:hypothetical protein
MSITFGAAAVLLVGILFGWLKTRHPALGGPISEGGRRLLEEMGLNVFTSVLALNSGAAVYQVLTQGPVWSLIVSCVIVSSVPALMAWWGRTSRAATEPRVAHGRHRRRATEHVVHAVRPGAVEVCGAWDRLPGAAGDHDTGLVGSRLLLCALRVNRGYHGPGCRSMAPAPLQEYSRGGREI